ncbi:hypothetical protein AB1J88_29415 [Pseudomonas sp. S8]|uniref:hypothetical protein n=1 Tax=Pseudomonas sp. S8 TaxID=211136 RepID=UPI003D2A74AC
MTETRFDEYTVAITVKLSIGCHRSNTLHDGCEEKSDVTWQCLAVDTGTQQSKKAARQVAFSRKAKAFKFFPVFISQQCVRRSQAMDVLFIPVRKASFEHLAKP